YWAGYRWLGVFYFHTGNYENAIEMFRKLTVLAPENYRGFYNLGAAQFQAGHWPEAEQSLKQSLALRETGAAYSNLATISFYEQRFAEAVRAFEAAARYSPKEEYIWGNLADAYRWSPGESQNAAETYQKAIALAEDQLRVDPRNAEVLANLARYRAKTQAPREAAQALAQALRWAPQDPTVLYSAAVVHNLTGQPKVALDWLNKAAERGYPLRLIQSDPEFRNLQHQPEFLRLVQTLEQKGN
ncbi:MAG: tetratricopeptide repeat protein, partial [Burkholderiales bacterium]